MDTATHVVMGAALGGLAISIDPVVAETTVNTNSVFIAAMIGSQIPDIDTILKLKNNAIYIRNHRGITHSLPAVLFWPILLTFSLLLFYPEANLFHLWLWSFIAVFLHVFVDIFNAYGTQALRPLSKKWVALGVINTFDPFIFGIHLAAILLWALGLDGMYTFVTMYSFMFIYYLLRFLMKAIVQSAIKKTLPSDEVVERMIVAPTMRLNQWRIAVITKEHYYVGRAFGRSITMFDKFERQVIPNTPMIQAARQDKNVSAFLSFSPVYRFKITELADGTFEVRFIDLRYRSNGHYPFVAIVHLNEQLEMITSYTGWIFSEEKLRKKLNLKSDSLNI